MDKKFIKDFLSKFDDNPFSIKFWDGEEFLIGTGTPLFKVTFNKPISNTAMLTSTSLALGEAYMKKDLDIDGDLFFALDSILRYKDEFHTNFFLLHKIFSKAGSMKKQKDEVSSHYDLGNDFYSLWLDKTLSYSCGYFKNENDSLYDAQMNKIHHILKKLNLKEGMTLLDIGCGFGHLLIEAAKIYKVNGVGITLSEEQYKEFKKKIENENLSQFIDVKLMDYRELSKSELKFDRVVSVGMLEHVGREHYDLFMENVNAVLKPKGVFLLHYISSLVESPGDAWIKKYIFPGGVIPSLREIISIFTDYNFYTVDVESLRRHYTKTLLYWLENFNKNKDQILEMFDESFIRMWELYLASCAACFNSGVVDLHQILITKGVNNDLPMTRTHIYK